MGHKEDRFLTPLFPLLLGLCSVGFGTTVDKVDSKVKKLCVRYMFTLYLLLNVSIGMKQHDMDGYLVNMSSIVHYLATEFQKGVHDRLLLLPLFAGPTICCIPPWRTYRRNLLWILFGEKMAKSRDMSMEILTWEMIQRAGFMTGHGANLTTNVPNTAILFDYQLKDWPVMHQLLDVNEMGLCRIIDMVSHVYSKCCWKRGIYH